MNTSIIESTVNTWIAEPEKAKVSPRVTARTEGTHAIIDTGVFSWKMDLAEAIGGENTAPSPTALLLGALSGCAAIFIKDTLAPQLGIEVDDVEAIVQCKTDARGLLGMENALPDLLDIELTIQIISDAPKEDIEHLFETWKQRCPVYLALLKPMNISTSLG
ncbi:OsmC family protein [Solitalea koreensis]|uniref:Uncharacterized OsmC-related protein n=1 Tax=Solitalea koreensis TaxID=543615 RepID=A0A521ACU1_9SPHI|nr:OsmC family protein [Solitalea koreensis]SMO32633.1 Uncharacterized OsmC-related protein [Solitalea koreensis]